MPEMIENIKRPHMTVDYKACDECEKTFPTSAQLKRHVRTVHNKVNPCEYCEKNLASRVSRLAHQSVCSENPYQFTKEDVDTAVRLAVADLKKTDVSQEEDDALCVAEERQKKERRKLDPIVEEPAKRQKTGFQSLVEFA
jgi:hypothetical protein